MMHETCSMKASAQMILTDDIDVRQRFAILNPSDEIVPIQEYR